MSHVLRVLAFLLAFAAFTAPAFAGCNGSAGVCAEAGAGRFALIADGAPAPVQVDAHDFPGVLRAVRSFQADLEAVSGAHRPATLTPPRGNLPVIVGTIGHSALIDRLVRARKLDVSAISGHWEAFVQQVVENPMPGVARALVIAGSDKRGTIYGIYDLDERIGVSPWSWWADVPIRPQSNVYIAPGAHVDEPRVHYRGIFLNDEDPALLGWVRQTYGGFNHQFYERVFDLILRLKGNYLWPAMWGKSLWDDDPQSADLADEMGIVLATSHHEPLQRSHVEWARHGHGDWNYATNAAALRDFWRDGMIRRGNHETVVTVGMRGDGDAPMTQGTAIQLLEQIVHDQRQIIEDVTHRPAAQTPQVWALYKEVQDYYDQGMRVPDDVTLLFSDDNWGNIRRLPQLGAAPRAGGYGVYYHFDYVGGPRNYKWINTNQIERTWEQMHLARAFGADRLWIVNVGDLKPMEFPISFFLNYAWNPEACDLECLHQYPSRWAAQQFGPEHADEIGELLTRYTQYNARRKPELIDPTTFSVVNGEAERVTADWNGLAARAQALAASLPAAQHDAYFQLVLYPILASANLNEMYVASGRNRLYAEQGRASAAEWGDRLRALFAHDAELTAQYHALGGGRWNHQMDQTHIGYTTWQQPDTNIMPEVRAVSGAARSPIGIAIEGDARVWPDTNGMAVLLKSSRYGVPTRTFEVFSRDSNSGVNPTVTPAQPWLHVSPRPWGRDQAFDVSVDWNRAPMGRTRVPIVVRVGTTRPLTIYADVFNPPADSVTAGFVESSGYVSMEAMHYAQAVNGNGVTWAQIPNLGRSAGGVTAFPVTAPTQTLNDATPHLDYDMHLFDSGDMQVQITTAPSLDFRGRNGLRYAVSIDAGAPQIVNMTADASEAAWNGWVANNANTRTTTIHVAAPGHHTLHLWLIDTGVVFERIVVAARPAPTSYLGPPESTLNSGGVQWPARQR